jgi:hypothetical protein
MGKMRCYALSFSGSFNRYNCQYYERNSFSTYSPHSPHFELCLVASLKNSAIEVIFILRIEHQPYDDPFAELSGNLRFWLKY